MKMKNFPMKKRRKRMERVRLQKRVDKRRRTGRD
jgi:hypothetical protein